MLEQFIRALNERLKQAKAEVESNIVILEGLQAKLADNNRDALLKTDLATRIAQVNEWLVFDAETIVELESQLQIVTT